MLQSDDLKKGMLFTVLNDNTVRQKIGVYGNVNTISCNKYPKGKPLRIVEINRPYIVYSYLFMKKIQTDIMDLREVDLIKITEEYAKAIE